MVNHADRLKDAKDSVSKLCSDMSVSRDTTRESLMELKDYIDGCLDALNDDEKEKDNAFIAKLCT